MKLFRMLKIFIITSLIMSIIILSITPEVYANETATCGLTYDIDPNPLPDGDYMVTYGYSAENLPTGINLVRHLEIYKDGSLYGTGQHFFTTTDGTYNSSSGGDYPPGSYTATLSFATYTTSSDTVILVDIFCQDTVNFIITSATQKRSTKPVWVRPMPMTCWQVWINEDNNFQFIFWYPYKDKNFIKIYDFEGNLVYDGEILLDEPNLIVDLPDGYYWVKTYHDQELLQEFLIGKP